MRFLHLSDLHIGKKINEISMLEDQKYIFNQITDYLSNNNIDAVVIAGDVYDQSRPSAEAMNVFSDFIEKIEELSLPVLIISGNHDSSERLSYFNNIMKKQKIYLGTTVSDSVMPVKLSDKSGNVNFYLLPFLRPSDVNNAFDTSCTTYTDAVKAVIERMNLDRNERNVMVSHQYVAGASVCDSEILIGGIECVDKSVYDDFDYTALGHLHTPQTVGKDTVRYCGTPLKYSLSEVCCPKSMTIVTLEEKGNVKVDTVPLEPLHDMRKLKGSFSELMQGPASDDYIYVELTDDNDVPFAGTELRTVYKNFISASYSRFASYSYFKSSAELGTHEEKTPQEIFTELFRLQHDNRELNEIQLRILNEAVERAWR